MPADNDPNQSLIYRARAAVTALLFGLAVLAFLVAIDRPHWFKLKPISGTAAAMAYAADGGPVDHPSP
jgi:hypothetical protein